MNDTHENIICPVCKTVNEPDYKFCKNCGRSLTENTQPNHQGAQYTPPPNFNGGYNYATPNGNYYGYYGKPYTDYSAVEPTLEDVDTKKVQAYVGVQKQDYFMQIFIAMKRLGRKLFINWPVAIMGALLAPPFAASWFFYRKMYRIGLIVCISCLLLTGISTVATYSEVKNELAEIVVETATLSDQELMNYTRSSENADIGYSYTSLVAYALQLISLVGVMFLAIYGNYFYYKHVTARIKKLDSAGGVKELFYYNIQGRPSVLSAVLIPFGFATLQSLIALAPYIEVLLSGVSPERLALILTIL